MARKRREMLDRLMGRTVLAEPDRIVRHDVDHALTHQRREPDRRAAIVGEDEEGAAIGHDAAMQGEAVHRRGHAVLAHAVMDVVAGETRPA